ncbi:MAG: stage III sporulation protein AB [Oscillospiraceae bacterium]
MLKTVSVILFITTTTLYGNYKSQKLNEKVKKSEEVERFLIFLESNIYYLRKPLYEIFNDIRINNYFENLNFVNETYKSENYDIKQTLILNIDNKSENISHNTKQILKDFINNFGNFDANEEIKKIIYYKKRLQEEIENIKLDKEKNGKVYKAVGFFTGVCISIFII